MKQHKGFTLIELLVAFVIGTGISLLAYQALSGSINIEQRVKEVTDQTNQLHRVWQLVNDDLQHAVARPWNDYLGNQQAAMLGDLGDKLSEASNFSLRDDSHVLRVVRSGESNFFQLPRSNLQIVGYRLVKNDKDHHAVDAQGDRQQQESLSLWRDHWRPVDSATEPTIKSRLLLDNITAASFRYLPKDSQTVNDEAWVSAWPESQQNNDQLPIGVEMTLEILGMGKITRLFSLVKADE
jgi:general secretion pathway protein J